MKLYRKILAIIMIITVTLSTVPISYSNESQEIIVIGSTSNNSNGLDLVQEAIDENSDVLILNKEQAYNASTKVKDFISYQKMIFFSGMTSIEVSEACEIPIEIVPEPDNDIRFGTAVTIIDDQYCYIDSVMFVQQEDEDNGQEENFDSDEIYKNVDIAEVVINMYKEDVLYLTKDTLPNGYNNVYTKNQSIYTRSGSYVGRQKYQLYFKRLGNIRVNNQTYKGFDVVCRAIFEPFAPNVCKDLRVKLAHIIDFNNCKIIDSTRIPNLNYSSTVQLSLPGSVGTSWSYGADAQKVTNSLTGELENSWRVLPQKPVAGDTWVVMPGTRSISSGNRGNIMVEIKVPTYGFLGLVINNWNILSGNYSFNL